MCRLRDANRANIQKVDGELQFLFTETRGDIKQISEELNRNEKAIRIKLGFLVFNVEEDVNCWDKFQQKDCHNETKKK